MNRIGAIILFAGVLLAANAHSAKKREWRDWPLGDRLTLSVGGFFPNIDTKVAARSADASFPAATRIDFESDLALADSASQPVGIINWRVTKRNSLELSYYKINRSGRSTTTVPIRFGDNEIPVNTPVYSFFDVDVLEFSYGYSLIFNRKIDWGVGFGLSLQDISLGIVENPDMPIIVDPETISVTAPLPTINTRVRYAFTDEMIGVISLGWLAVEADLSETTDFSGSIWSSGVGLRYKPFKYASFAALWNIFYMDIDYNKRDLVSELDYTYSGPVLVLQGYF